MLTLPSTILHVNEIRTKDADILYSLKHSSKDSRQPLTQHTISSWQELDVENQHPKSFFTTEDLFREIINQPLS